MKSKFPADYLQGILDTFLSRTFFISVFCVIVYEIKIYKIIILPAVLYGCVTLSHYGGMENDGVREQGTKEYIRN
jgi:hypothetical protein